MRSVIYLFLSLITLFNCDTINSDDYSKSIVELNRQYKDRILFMNAYIDRFVEKLHRDCYGERILPELYLIQSVQKYTLVIDSISKNHENYTNKQIIETIYYVENCLDSIGKVLKLNNDRTKYFSIKYESFKDQVLKGGKYLEENKFDIDVYNFILANIYSQCLLLITYPIDNICYSPRHFYLTCSVLNTLSGSDLTDSITLNVAWVPRDLEYYREEYFIDGIQLKKNVKYLEATIKAPKDTFGLIEDEKKLVVEKGEDCYDTITIDLKYHVTK